jgi:hypothetical protein
MRATQQQTALPNNSPLSVDFKSRCNPSEVSSLPQPDQSRGM